MLLSKATLANNRQCIEINLCASISSLYGTERLAVASLVMHDLGITFYYSRDEFRISLISKNIKYHIGLLRNSVYNLALLLQCFFCSNDMVSKVS